MSINYLPLTVETEMDVSRQLDESAIVAIMRWLRKSGISLVHSVTLMREVGEAARRLHIPHAASLYATESRNRAGVFHCDIVHSDSLLYANRWSEVLDAPARRILSYVPEQYFEIGDAGYVDELSGSDNKLTLALFGTLQPRKGQLQAIEAVGLLKERYDISVGLRLYGYNHFFPDYLAACMEMAARYNVSDLVSFPGFIPDTVPALREVDVVICASDWESLPQAILEAMAAGRLVIAPSVGGIPEVVSSRTGILMPDNSAASICQAVLEALALKSEDRRDRVNLAQKVARSECSGYSVATEVFRLYHQAIMECDRTNKRAASPPGILKMTTSPEPFFDPDVPKALERLRSSLHEINAEMRLME
jgi:glycosyltransferase involved in cell wall biosynthesis